MSKFCILRVKKLHDNGNVGAAIAHHFRTRKTDNADPSKIRRDLFFPAEKRPNNADYNYRLRMHERAMAIFKRNLNGVKVRKNAVKACELLMTTSNREEILENNADFDFKAYLNDCKKWAEQKFGKENIFCVAEHFDETTPHISILFTPIVDGKLNARALFGGATKMTELQDDFFKEVGQKYGLERGLHGSKANHREIKQIYAEAKLKSEREAKEYIVEKRFLESKESHNQRQVTRINSLIEQKNEEIRREKGQLEAVLNAEKAQRQHLNELLIAKDKRIDELVRERDEAEKRWRKDFERICYNPNREPLKIPNFDGRGNFTTYEGLYRLAQSAHDWRDCATAEALRKRADEIEKYGCKSWTEMLAKKESQEKAPKIKKPQKDWSNER